MDRELVRRCQQGDRSAFDELVRRHYKRAYALALRMLGNRDDASDAVQQAFIRAYQGLAGYRGGAAFSTWLYRIVVNVCLDMSRRSKRANAASLSRSPEEEAPEKELPDDRLGPAEKALQAARVEAVHKALQHVQPTYRAVLVMYELQGMSYEQIAQALGIPVGTVKSRLNRARAAFAQAFQPYLELFDMPAGRKGEPKRSFVQDEDGQ